MSTFEDTNLNHFLVRREQLITDLTRLFGQAQSLLSSLGYAEQANTDFTSQIERLKSDTIRLVVIGEFSRGKSHLVNALLRQEVLIHAPQQTTACNTFVQGTDGDPYIEIEFWDESRPKERLALETNALLKWTTELDPEGANARKDVRIVNIYSNHPLFQNNFVLVDTPGFEGIVEGHEAIARRAIDSAHIAIWCQSAEQLGGNKHEWEFLEKTISRQFERFLTIINKWDLIFARTNIQDRDKTDAELEASSLRDIVSNFRKKLEPMEVLNEQEMERITSSDNLFGVSAYWALSDDPVKQSKSNIDLLENRIVEICQKEKSQIIRQPAKFLLAKLDEISNHIQTELTELQSSKTVDERERELLRLDKDITNLEKKHNGVVQRSEKTHRTQAGRFQQMVQTDLVLPLKELRDNLDVKLSLEFFEEQLEEAMEGQSKTIEIGIPSDLKDEFQHQLQRVGETWSTQKQEITQTLQALQQQYADEVATMTESFQNRFSTFDVALPGLEVNINFSFDRLLKHRQQEINLKSELEELEGQQEDIQDQLNAQTIEEKQVSRRLKALEERENRIREELQLHGAPPPLTQTPVQSGMKGVWGFRSPTYKTISNQSDINQHKEIASEIRSRRSDIEKEIRGVQNQVQETTGKLLSREQALNKVNRELKKRERALEKSKEESRQRMEKEARRIHDKIRSQTIQTLDSQIKMLTNDVSEAIDTIFNKQLEALKQSVDEQYLRPLNEKKDQLTSVKQLLEQDKSAIEERTQELNQLAEECSSLQTTTTNILHGDIEHLFPES